MEEELKNFILQSINIVESENPDKHDIVYINYLDGQLDAYNSVLDYLKNLSK